MSSNMGGEKKGGAETKEREETEEERALKQHARPYWDYKEGTVGSINGLSVHLPAQESYYKSKAPTDPNNQHVEWTNFDAGINEPCISNGDKFTMAALTYAVLNEDAGAVRLLVENGADPLVPDSIYKNPLMLAIRTETNNATIMKLLLQYFKKDEDEMLKLITFLKTPVEQSEASYGGIVNYKATGLDLLLAAMFKQGNPPDLSRINLPFYHSTPAERELISFIYDIISVSPKATAIAEGTGDLLPIDVAALASEFATESQFEGFSILIPNLPIHKQTQIAETLKRIKNEHDEQEQLKTKVKDMAKDMAKAKRPGSASKLSGSEPSKEESEEARGSKPKGRT